MDGNKAIFEAIAELEMILYYARNDQQLAPEIEEMHQEAKTMLERWHFLTGETN